MSADPIAEGSGCDYFTEDDVNRSIRAVGPKLALLPAQAEALLEDLRTIYYSYRIWNGVDQSPTKNEMQAAADSLKKAMSLLEIALRKVHSNKAVEKELVKEISYVLYDDLTRLDLEDVDGARFLDGLEGELRTLSQASDTLESVP
jgi:hypothetical protein